MPRIIQRRGKSIPRGVQSYNLCARGVENMLAALRPGVLRFHTGLIATDAS